MLLPFLKGSMYKKARVLLPFLKGSIYKEERVLLPFFKRFCIQGRKGVAPIV